MKKIRRRSAIRVVSGYRTVSHDAACVLARTPPLHLLAIMRKNVYFRVRVLRDDGQYSLEAVRNIKRDELLTVRGSWGALVRSAGGFGVYTRRAIEPVFDEWLDRSHGHVSFRITQFLTGHGCFMAFLNRIGKADEPTCFYCDAEDTVLHTLLECVQWSSERAELRSGLDGLRGGDLTLAGIVACIVGSSDDWKEFSKFAESVLRSKEEEERRRERVGVG